jgi:hypothetical protein
MGTIADSFTQDRLMFLLLMVERLVLLLMVFLFLMVERLVEQQKPEFAPSLNKATVRPVHLNTTAASTHNQLLR